MGRTELGKSGWGDRLIAVTALVGSVGLSWTALRGTAASGVLSWSLAGAALATSIGVAVTAWPRASGRYGDARRRLRLRRRRATARRGILVPGDRPEPRDRLAPAELPPSPTPFVGRSRELRAIREHLDHDGADQPRVIVLTGPVGIGKTTLAAAAAAEPDLLRRYPDGRIFADLATLEGMTEEELVSQALGRFITALKGPADEVDDSSYRALQYGRLSGEYRVLIVIDNADDARVVRRLLPVGPTCAVIVTTAREDFEDATEWLRQPVEPLSESASMQLLRALVPGGWMHDEAVARRIVEPMAGHPRSIRLAATQLARRSDAGYEAISRIYDDPAARLSARRAERSAVADGHSGDQAPGLYIGFGLLGEDERAALRVVGMLNRPTFAPWMLTAALDWDDTTVGRVLDRLLLSGFVSRGSAGPSEVPILRISADVRTFARQRFELESRPPDRARLRIRYQDRSEHWQSSQVERLTDDVFDHLAAGRVADAFATARGAVELARDAPQLKQRGLALAVLAELRAELGAAGSAAEQAEEVLRMDRTIPVARSRALRTLARLARRQHDYGRARALLEDAIVEESTLVELLLCRRDLAVVEARDPAGDSGASLIEQAFRDCDALPGNGPGYRAGLHWAQSLVHQCRGQTNAARLSLRDGELAALRRAQRLWLAWIAHRHARLLLESQPLDADTAVRQAVTAVDGFTAMGHRYGQAHAALVLGEIHLRQSQALSDESADVVRHQALLRLQDAREAFTEAGDPAAADAAAALIPQARPPRRPGRSETPRPASGSLAEV